MVLIESRQREGIQRILLRIAQLANCIPAAHTISGWEAGDIQGMVAELTKRDAQFERYDWLTQDENSIVTLPRGDRLVWLKDPAGNGLPITQFSSQQT